MTFASCTATKPGLFESLGLNCPILTNKAHVLLRSINQSLTYSKAGLPAPYRPIYCNPTKLSAAANPTAPSIRALLPHRRHYPPVSLPQNPSLSRSARRRSERLLLTVNHGDPDQQEEEGTAPPRVATLPPRLLLGRIHPYMDRSDPMSVRSSSATVSSTPS
jgi:hypothetical protein